MVCTIKNSNTFLTFYFFLIPHTLPLGRYVSTSRHQNALDMHFQLSIYRNSLKWMIFALSPFSPISLMQDYIYSKYPTQLTQLNNTHLKNLASNQIRRCRVRNSKFVFFCFTRENVWGYFASLLHEKNADIWHEIQGITCDRINLSFFKVLTL